MQKIETFSFQMALVREFNFFSSQDIDLEKVQPIWVKKPILWVLRAEALGIRIFCFSSFFSINIFIIIWSLELLSLSLFQVFLPFENPFLILLRFSTWGEGREAPLPQQMEKIFELWSAD